MHGLHYRSLGMFLLTWCFVGCATVPPAAAPAAPPPTSATAGTTTIVAIAPSAPIGPPKTIWDFLGVQTLKSDICLVAGCAFNLLESQFPSLAAGLPSSALGTPLSASSSNPAVAAAAAAKADESAAPQKVKALRYLGTLGCGGCYPDVEKALLAGLDDCTESVRFEAASVLSETSRNRCRYCDSNRCCSTNVRKKLIKIASETHDNGCYVEPSARVRRIARVALCNCGCDPIDEPPPMPTEGPSSDGAVPPKPEPLAGVKVYAPRPSEPPVETANFAGKNSRDDRQHQNARTIESTTSAGANAKSTDSVAKQYDQSHKQPDIVVKPTEAISKTAFPVAKTEVSRSTATEIRRDQSLPRIRWERAAVSIYRFESKDQAVSAMDFIRRKALGENPDTPSDPNLKYVTTREVGWTRPQDVRSPELAKILFELPVGQIGPVIEVGDTLLVCRVLEKEPPDSDSSE